MDHLRAKLTALPNGKPDVLLAFRDEVDAMSARLPNAVSDQKVFLMKEYVKLAVLKEKFILLDRQAMVIFKEEATFEQQSNFGKFDAHVRKSLYDTVLKDSKKLFLLLQGHNPNALRKCLPLFQSVLACMREMMSSLWPRLLGTYKGQLTPVDSTLLSTTAENLLGLFHMLQDRH
jgi:hypothetical protein